MRLLNRIRLFATFRYTDPSLHPGKWGDPDMLTSRHGARMVRWERVEGGWLSEFVGPHPHQAFVCVIGPGMAHEDTCLCGAKRYGVFGSWS